MTKTVALVVVASVSFACAHGGSRSTPGDTPLKMQASVSGEGPLLVLLGDGLTGWLTWIPHQERLAGQHSVARLQPLNVQMGLEARPLPADYSVRMESRALGATLDDLSPQAPVDLVAASYGGVIALDFALEHSERIKTLTLIEPAAPWVLQATGRLNEESRRELVQLRRLYEQMQTGIDEQQLAAFVRATGLAPAGQRPEELPTWPLMVRHRASLRNGRALFSHTDSIDRLRGFDRPVLLFKGTGSAGFLHAIVDALAATLPHAEIVELPGGHTPHVVAMAAFLDRVEAFQKRALVEWLP